MSSTRWKNDLVIQSNLVSDSSQEHVMLLIVLTELKAQGIDKIDNKCSTLVFFPHAD